MIEELRDKFNLDKKDFEYFFKFIKLSHNFNNLWRMKSTARETLRDWLIATDIKIEVAENCANACSELIENCIKFSSENKLSFILISIANYSIVVETFNEAIEDQKVKIVKFFKNFTNGHENITNLYIDKIKESMVTGKSQLGLIKILLETGGKLELLDKEEKGLIHIKLKIDINK